MYYTGQSSLRIHAGSPILLRLELVRETFVKMSAQRSLWRISNIQTGGRREEIKEVLRHFLCNFCRCPILSFPFTCTSMLFNILMHTSATYNHSNKEWDPCFYMSHLLPIQIFYTIPDKMDKNRRLLKIKGKVRGLQCGSE